MNVAIHQKPIPVAQKIEQHALRELHAAASQRLRAQLGMHLEESGGALLSAFSRDPSIVLNRVSGLGLISPATPQQIDNIIDFYRHAGVGRFFLQDCPQATPAERITWYEEAGLVRQRAWMKFCHNLESLPPRSEKLAVEPVDATRAMACADIIVHGFDLQARTAELLATMIMRPGWHPVVVRIGEKVAGTASLYINGDIGWCDWAATHPDYRGRGVQTALLLARLHRAREAGCRAVYSTTGAAAPGDPQHSYNNLLRVGFREEYLTENYAPAGSAWS